MCNSHVYNWDNAYIKDSNASKMFKTLYSLIKKYHEKKKNIKISLNKICYQQIWCFLYSIYAWFDSNLLRHGEEHVKKFYSTVAIDKRGHALNRCVAIADTNTCAPWLSHWRTKCDYNRCFSFSIHLFYMNRTGIRLTPGKFPGQMWR